jgi:hypothetical protein
VPGPFARPMISLLSGRLLLIAQARRLIWLFLSSPYLSFVYFRIACSILTQSSTVIRQVRFWHFASFRCVAKFVGYWTNNGQRSARRLNGSAANDP